MTRKRFVKNLMSRGISRNQANEIAQRHSQRKAYEDFKGLDRLEVIIAEFGITAKKASERFNRFYRVWRSQKQ